MLQADGVSVDQGRPGDGTVKKFAIIGGQPTLMLYILWNRDWRETEFLLPQLPFDTIQRMKDCGVSNIHDVRDDCSILTKEINRSNIPKRLLRKISVLLLELKKIRPLAQKVKHEQIPLYVQDTIAQMFRSFRGIDYHCLEDGLGSYNTPKDWRRLNYSMRFEDHDMWVPQAKELCFSGRLPIPDALKKRSIVRPLEESWQDLTEEDQQDICYIFEYPIERIKQLSEEGRDIFFLSQPLYPTRTKDERVWTNIVSEIFSHYNEKRIVVKLHRRDSYDYKKHFPNVEVLDSACPFELFAFMKAPIRKIVTVDSTAAIGIWPDGMVEMYEHYGEELERQANARK